MAGLSFPRDLAQVLALSSATLMSPAANGGPPSDPVETAARVQSLYDGGAVPVSAGDVVRNLTEGALGDPRSAVSLNQTFKSWAMLEPDLAAADQVATTWAELLRTAEVRDAVDSGWTERFLNVEGAGTVWMDLNGPSDMFPHGSINAVSFILDADAERLGIDFAELRVSAFLELNDGSRYPLGGINNLVDPVEGLKDLDSVSFALPKYCYKHGDDGSIAAVSPLEPGRKIVVEHELTLRDSEYNPVALPVRSQGFIVKGERGVDLTFEPYVPGAPVEAVQQARAITEAMKSIRAIARTQAKIEAARTEGPDKARFERSLTGPEIIPQPGTPAPAIGLLRWENPPAGISVLTPDNPPTFEGKVTVIDIWADWCGPCLVSLPKLSTLQKNYGPDLQVLSLCMTTAPQDFDEAAQRLNPSFAHHFGLADLETTHRYGATFTREDGSVGAVIPRIVIIDQKGNVSWVQSGALANPEPEIRRLLGLH